LIAYADTSFLLSLYLYQSNSSLALKAVGGLEMPMLITGLGELEFRNALGLHVFRKEMTEERAESALAKLLVNISSGGVRSVPLPLAAFDEAARVSRKYTRQLGTRSLDVLHVGSALSLSASRFCTLDEAQRRLAKAVGLTVLPT
jgi:predicted nucleic acid-binding protein